MRRPAEHPVQQGQGAGAEEDCHGPSARDDQRRGGGPLQSGHKHHYGRPTCPAVHLASARGSSFLHALQQKCSGVDPGTAPRRGALPSGRRLDLALARKLLFFFKLSMHRDSQTAIQIF